MFFSSSSPIIADTPQLKLEIPSDALSTFWQRQSFTTDGIQWQAALNQASLQALLPWVREFAPNARIWTNSAALSSFWEIVNGAAIEFEQHRLIMIPTAAIDHSELRVPQEWVDLPSWAGDYYVSVSVNLEDDEVQVLGYATHQTLKQQGQYDPLDRTYSLDEAALIADTNVIWLSRQLCPTEVLRSELSALPKISIAQAETLLGQLGTTDVILPRLAVSFQQWGALLEHSGWRQRLYQHRLGLPEQWSVQQWLQDSVSTLAEQFGWGATEMRSNLAWARGSERAQKVLLRSLTIAGKPYELRVFQKSEDVWRFELQSTAGALIPGGFKLRLLTEDLLPFENNEDVATNAIDCLYLEVRLAPGDALVWETEPLPESYEREILCF
ncbi:MAG: hypothetical protein C4288_15590 [Leptolyngbya sp. ERB_1_1]